MDLVIRGAQLVDGTGEAARSADIGIVDGKIVEIGGAGSIGAVAGKTVDADGQVLMPGAIDPHTHYDANLVGPDREPVNRTRGHHHHWGELWVHGRPDQGT